MKAARLVSMALAMGLFVCTAALRFNPSLVVLLSRDVKVRSPFCSRWQATLDGQIKLRQQAVADELRRQSRRMRQEDGLELWSTPRGQIWVPAQDAANLPLLLAREERNLYGVGEQAVHEGDVVLDAGAYIGTWTKRALARGAKLVVAIERTPSAVECLKRNLAAEIAQGRVLVYPKGIGDTTTVDQMAAELSLSRVDFIKADLKGATEQMVRGGAAVLKRDRPRMAFSTEDPTEDVASIARAAQGIVPGYQIQCGPCLLDGRDIYTDVLFVH